MVCTADNGRWTKPAALAVLFALLVATAGCATATPRYVEAVDSSEDRVKFLYHQKDAHGQWQRGVIECDLVDDQFQDCRHIEMEFEQW